MLAPPRPVMRSNVRSPFQHSFETYFVRRPKIEHVVLTKLQSTVSRQKGALRPSVISHYNGHARSYDQCNAQQRAVPFRHSFEPILHGTQKSIYHNTTEDLRT